MARAQGTMMKTTSAAVVTALAMAWITTACDGPRAAPDTGPVRVDSGPITVDDGGPMADAGPMRDGGIDGGTMNDGGMMSDGGPDAGDGGMDPDSAIPSVDGGPIVVCGDGVVSGTELCDPAIPSGSPGACPTSCNDGLACTSDVLMGTASACDARCTTTPVTACTAGDGCCPSTCTATEDDDCSTCTPRTTCAAGECGTLDDGCGGPLDCGACAVGGACDVDADCASGVCITELSSGWPGGYCSLGCVADADCGAGAHCAFDDDDGFGACVVDCATGGDCRAGYSCHNTDGDVPATTECAPTGAGTAGIGATCTSTAQCAGGDDAFCIVEAQGWQGGYCTRTCDDDADCGVGAHCGLIDADSGEGVCIVDCAGPTCRAAGYACHDIDGDAESECAPSATGAGVTGGACRAAFECSGGVDGRCITQPDWIDGYCTVVDCVTDSDCTSTAGGHCTTIGTVNLCTSNCTTDADCRNPGYVCSDLDTDGTRECWPGATGTGEVGSPCELIWQCGGGERGACFREDTGLFRQGYCTMDCASGACPAGSHCSVIGSTSLCVEDCGSDSDCRADGYRCHDAPNDADTIRECWPAGTGTGAVGAPCAGVWACGGGTLAACAQDDPDTAEVEWPNGYCLRTCETSACPSGSSCVALTSTSACFDNCTGAGMGDCRPGYTCGNAGVASNVCF